MQEMVEQRLELIRPDPTAHQLRLESLLPGLIEDFADRYDDAESRTAADALADSRDAPVRSFVMTLAHLNPRGLLRRRVPAPTS